MECTIRPAVKSDLPVVVALIRGLADYENLPGPDDSAAARLEEHGFGRNPYFEVLLAEFDGEIAGFALYFMTYSTFRARPSLYLEDLFVLPAHRRRGAATSLLKRLAELALERECGRFEWTVLDWNTSAQEFYRSLGAEVLPDWRICRIDQRTSLVRLAERP